MYGYMYMYIYIYVYIYIHDVCIHIHIIYMGSLCKDTQSTDMYGYMHIYILRICIYTFMHMYIYISYIWARCAKTPSRLIYTSTCIYTHTLLYIYVYISYIWAFFLKTPSQPGGSTMRTISFCFVQFIHFVHFFLLKTPSHPRSPQMRTKDFVMNNLFLCSFFGWQVLVVSFFGGLHSYTVWWIWSDIYLSTEVTALQHTVSHGNTRQQTAAHHQLSDEVTTLKQTATQLQHSRNTAADTFSPFGWGPFRRWKWGRWTGRYFKCQKKCIWYTWINVIYIIKSDFHPHCNMHQWSFSNVKKYVRVIHHENVMCVIACGVHQQMW